MEYKEVELESFGRARVFQNTNKKYPYSLQFITEKLNNKDLDYQDIEEFMLTKKELEDLQEAIGKILT